MKHSITVSYATPERQIELPLDVEPSCTVAMAIKRSGILETFPAIDLANAVVGIHSRKVALDDLVQNQDRVEIYRSLEIDPKLARRLRVKTR